MMKNLILLACCSFFVFSAFSEAPEDPKNISRNNFGKLAGGVQGILSNQACSEKNFTSPRIDNHNPLLSKTLVIIQKYWKNFKVENNIIETSKEHISQFDDTKTYEYSAIIKVDKQKVEVEINSKDVARNKKFEKQIKSEIEQNV